jgi:hypothetical protein
VRFEQQDLTECLFEVTAEADGAIVDKDVCGGLSPGDGRDIREQPVLPQPSSNLGVMARGEHHDVETTLGQRPQERSDPRTRSVAAGSPDQSSGLAAPY